MEKTAFVLPGIGYHVDKPLLYFGKKLAREAGYRIVEIPFHGFAKGVKGDKKKMTEAFELALEQTEAAIGKESFSSPEEYVFLSKSIGTAAAAAFQRRHGFRARNIYFTPVEDTFVHAQEDSGIVFHGTADPWIATDTVKEGCRRLGLPLFLTEKANHSLETGDALADLAHLSQVMQECARYLGPA